MLHSAFVHARPPAASGPRKRTLRPRSVLPHRAARHGIHRSGARGARPRRHDRRSALQRVRRAAAARTAPGARRHRRHARARDRRGARARARGPSARARTCRSSSAATPRPRIRSRSCRPSRRRRARRRRARDAGDLSTRSHAASRCARARSGDPTRDGGIARTAGETGRFDARRRAAARAAARRRLAPPVRVPCASSDVADRNGARLPVPLFVLLDLAAARAIRARTVDRVGLPRTSQLRSAMSLRRRRSVLVSPVAQPGAGARAAAPRHPQAVDPRAEPDRSRRAGIRSCSKRGGRSRKTSTSSSASKRRPTKGSTG